MKRTYTEPIVPQLSVAYSDVNAMYTLGETLHERLDIYT